MSSVSTQQPTAEELRQQFTRDGYLCPLPALDTDETARFLSSYEDYTRRNGERLADMPANKKYQVFSETHFVLPWVHEIVTHPRILDTVEKILGPNLLAWNTNWFSKMPGEKSFVGWHQDGTYWNLEPPTVVTAWVALTPSLTSNGCLRIMPGTHTQPKMPQRETYQPDNALSRGQEIAVEVDESKAVDLNLQPGQMSLHHIWLVHGSSHNTSPDTPRIGIAIRYTIPQVKQDSPTKPVAMLVRGRDDYGHFDVLPAPQAGSAEEQTRRHSEIVDRIRSGIMKEAAKAA